MRVCANFSMTNALATVLAFWTFFCQSKTTRIFILGQRWNLQTFGTHNRSSMVDHVARWPHSQRLVQLRFRVEEEPGASYLSQWF
jgi:hypothetical protein